MSASPNFPNLPSSWIEETQYLPADKNIATDSIFYREFRRADSAPDGVRRGRVMFIVHGFGEQSDRFRHFPHYLHTSLDAIGLIDLPGHGKSKGQRGHIDSFDLYSQAALAGFSFLQQRTAKTFPSSHFHWFGASMGGLITLRTLFKNRNLPLSSCIVTEPQLGIAVEVPFIKEFMAKIIAPVLGHFSMHNELDAKLLSHDKSVQDAYNDNPLNHSRITPRTYIEMQKEMAALEVTKDRFPYSLLMLTPLADPIVSWKKELQFFKRLQQTEGKKKSLATFPNFFHEAFNEVGKEKPFLALEEWLKNT